MQKNRIFDRREMPFYTHLFKGITDNDKAKRVRQHFTAVRCFHQCRPRDPSAYYQHGFQLPNGDAIIDEACRIYRDFVGPCDRSVAAKIAADLGRYSRPDPICLSFEFEFGLAHASHYLVYGSEFLSCVVMRMPHGADGTDPRHVMKKVGIPTLFELVLPIDFCPDTICNQVARMIADYAEEDDCFKVPHAADEGFGIAKAIPPEYIVNHWHPPIIFDQFADPKVYNNPFTTCPACRQVAVQRQKKRASSKPS